MLGQLNSNQPAFQLQSELSDWVKIIKPLYLTFVSLEFRNRPNANNGKLSDPLLLALLCWQVDLKITVQTRYYHFLANNIFPRDSLPERSRFNRLCRQAGNALQQIRFDMIKEYVTPTYAIIDSLPLPLCKPVRNLRKKVLKGQQILVITLRKRCITMALKVVLRSAMTALCSLTFSHLHPFMISIWSQHY